MDLLIQHGMRPFIVAIPPGSPGTYDRATEWANGPAQGQHWFTYLTRDVVGAVDSHFRTLRKRRTSAASPATRRAPTPPSTPGCSCRTSSASSRAGAATTARPRPRSDRNAWLVHRFSALDTAPAARPARRPRRRALLPLRRATTIASLAATVQVAHALRRGGVPVRLDVTGGGHSWRLWADRFDGALRWFAQQTERGLPA